MASQPMNYMFVEGPHDEAVITQLCRSNSVLRSAEVRFQFKVCEGVDNLMRDIREPFHLQDEDPETAGAEVFQEMLEIVAVSTKTAPIVGIVVDADDFPERRWQALRDRLIKRYDKFPKHPPPGGLILPRQPNGGARLGVWLMPDNCIEGMMESFLVKLAPDGDSLVACAAKALESLPEQRFRDAHRSKALLHTWLAWQREPGVRPALALKSRLLDPEHIQTQAFVSWLKELFAPASP